MIDGSPTSREISLFSGSDVCLPHSATATQLCRRFYQYAQYCVCRCPDACRLFRTSPITTNLSMLFFERNSVINCYNLYHSCRLLIKILSSLLSGVKVAAFARYSVKIRVIFGVRFERRKVEKKQIYMKTETYKLYSRDF